jgi:streptogramin lyase
MNERKLIVSSLMLLSIIFSACAPAATTKATPLPTIQSADTMTPTDLPIIQPTNTAAFILPASDPIALATLAGNYTYRVGTTFNFILNADGSYISLASSGRFMVTADQITFVENSPDCASQLGAYKWSLDDNVLHLIPTKDDCQRRAGVFGSQVFEKVPESNTSATVIWEIPARLNGIATDLQGNVYATDEDTRGGTSFFKYDPTGKLLGSWSSGLSYTTGIAVDGQGNIYVANFEPPAIHKFTPDGNPVLTWTIADGVGPAGLAVDSQGNVYVALHRIHDHYIEKYDPQGKLLGTWAKPDTAGGQIKAGARTGPVFIAVAVNGDNYIQDDEQAAKYDKDGKFIYSIPQKCSLAVDSQGNLYLFVSEDSTLLKFDSAGKQIGKWSAPIHGYAGVYGIVIDIDGNVLLSTGTVLAKIKLPVQ